MFICIYHGNPAPSTVNSCRKKRGEVEKERVNEGWASKNCLWRRHARSSPVSTHLPHAFFPLKESFNGSTWRDSKDGTASLLWPLTWDMLSPWWASACGGRDANNNVINAAQKFLPFERDRRIERERRLRGYKKTKGTLAITTHCKSFAWHLSWVFFSRQGKCATMAELYRLGKTNRQRAEPENSCLSWLIRVSDGHAAGCSLRKP